MGRARCRHRKVVQNPHSVQADTHDYLLRRPKARRLHPSSKSGPDMIISCGNLRLVGSARQQKVVQNPHSILSRSVGRCSKGCTRTLTIYGVARGLVGGPASRWGGVPKSCTRTPILYTTSGTLHLRKLSSFNVLRSNQFSQILSEIISRQVYKGENQDEK